MPHSLLKQREKLQEYTKQSLTTGISDKQRYNRQKRLEEYIKQLVESLTSKVIQVYKKRYLEEISRMVKLIKSTNENLYNTQLQDIVHFVAARLQAYKELADIVKKLHSLEYQLYDDQQVFETIQSIGIVIEIYHKALYDHQMNTPHNPYHTSHIVHHVSRYAMSDNNIQQELHRLYPTGRLDRMEVLTSLFNAYFLYLESQGKHPSIMDVRQIMFEVFHDEGKVAEVNTLLVEREEDSDRIIHQEQGIVDVVKLNIFEKGTGKITAYMNADDSMKNAVRDALVAATNYLNSLVDPDINLEMFDYSWSVGTLGVQTSCIQYKQESIGLSIAVAAIAAYLGKDVNPAIAMTGKVDLTGNVHKVNIEHKCTIDKQEITTLILPEGNRAEIPVVGVTCEIKTVRNIGEAVEIIFGKATLREIQLSRYKHYRKYFKISVKQFLTQVSPDLYNPDLYVERRETEEQIERFLQSSLTCLILTGDAGMGKTNLLYHLCERYQEEGYLLWIQDCVQLVNFEDFIQRLIETVDQTASLEKIFSRLNQLANFIGKKVVIILDALNEAGEQAKNWFRLLKKLVETLTQLPHIKLIISCKTNTWNILQDIVNHGKILAPETYQICSLGKFSPKEFEQVKKRLTQGKLPDICRYPFLIRMIDVVYTSRGRKVPAEISIIDLFQSYLTRRTERVPDTQVFIQVIIAELWNVTIPQQGNIYGIPYTRLVVLYNEQLKGSIFESFAELFNYAKEQSLLIEVKTEQELYVRFRFDWLVEYLLGKYLYEEQCQKHPMLSHILPYLRNKERSSFLEGAIKYVFLLANAPELFLEVSQTLDNFDETLISTVLLWHREDPDTVLSLLSAMIGTHYATIPSIQRFGHIATYMQVVRVLALEGIRRASRMLRGVVKQPPPRITELHYSVPLFALKIASLIGTQGIEILLFAIADRRKTEQFRQKAVDYLGNIYNQATIAHQSFILEKAFDFIRKQSNVQTLYRLVYFVMRCYMQSYNTPEITAKMFRLISTLVQGFGKRPLVIMGRFAVKLFLDKISNRESNIYETFFQREDRGRLLEFIGLLDDTAQPAKAEIERLEQFILEVSRSGIPERFVHFFFGTRILFFCGVKDFSLVKESLALLYEELPYTTRDLIPGVIGPIYWVHPTEDTFRLLEEISWKIIEKDKVYLIKGGHEENNMYYPLTPIGIASGRQQGDHPAPIDFFVQVLQQAIAEHNWGLINHCFRELGTVGNICPESVLLTLQSVVEYINVETKNTFIRALALISIRFPGLVTQFLQEQLEYDNPYIPDIRRGVLTYEDDGTLQRVVDSSILYDFFTLMFIQSKAFRSYIIDVGSRVNDFDNFDDLIEYGLSKAIDILTNA